MCAAKVYRIHQGSLQEQFDNLRTKVQFYGGGFANGKTAASVVLKALKLARDYPGSNGLIARSTYPKLNDTIRKEFLKWCPKHWIKSFPMSQNGSNTCTLTNGTTINFRYVAQQGNASAGEQSTSNLLSATYDWIIVDQIEDPEIVEKDFDDLLGRLRGMTPYRGDDPTMPRTGPRWFIITANPTRNWVYKKLIRPYHVYAQTGQVTDDMLVVRDDNGAPKLDENGNIQPLLGIVEGSTYENADNLEPDFIQTLESTYKGAMRERFLMGGWAAYEGLVYPQFDPMMHVLPYDTVMDYLNVQQENYYELGLVEGYDFGIAVPSCYIIGRTDAWGNIFLFDGFYRKGEEFPLEDQREFIKDMRRDYGVTGNPAIMADPAIFRRTSASKRTIGKSTADILYDSGNGVRVVRGNNDILNGIIKVSSYLAPSRMHPHPITGEHGAPHLYITDNLTWLEEEFGTYMWKTNSRGEREDLPQDKNDHGMDTVKYIVSRRPELAKLPKYVAPQMPSIMKWHERDIAAANPKAHRYG